MSEWTMRSVMPTLGVDDLESAVSYYAKLGFGEQWRYPEHAPATHVGVALHQVSLMLWHCAGPIDRQNLYFVIEGLSAFHQHAAATLPDIGPLQETDYGMKDVSITDPWGHLLTFGVAQ